jgi:hypothetical protein
MTLSDSRQHRRPRRRRGRDPHAWAGLPSYPRHPSGVPCPLPRWTAAGASVGCFPAMCSLPRNSGGSASTTSLSRPAQASLALRPVGSLNRPRRPSSRGFSLPGCPDRPLVSYQIKPTTIWVEPPSTGDARHLGALNNPGVRRETGRRQEVQVLRDEGVATHIGPEPCALVREDRGEASVGVCVGQPLSGDSYTIRSAEGVPDPEGNTGSLAIARGCLAPRRQRPWHAHQSPAREPGDLRACPGRRSQDRAGKAKRP